MLFPKVFENASEVQVKRTKWDDMVSNIRIVLALGLEILIAKPLPMFRLTAEGMLYHPVAFYASPRT
jgi:hypothetical protein